MSMAEVINSIEHEAFERCIKPPTDDGMKEYRCSCGRLLGRFNGRAEIKCPKCREMNMIGGKEYVDSGNTR